MMVKICGITNREDALASAEAGASAIGFNFYPRSPRAIAPEAAALIGEGLPLLKVGVFVDEDPARVEEIASTAGLDAVQLHGGERSAPCGRRAWKALRVTENWRPEVLDEYAGFEAIVLDGPAPGSGTQFDWSRIPRSAHRIILAGGLDDSNVVAGIEQVRPWGVDACSRLEKSPGIKDHDKVLRFVRAALAVQL